MYYKVEISNNQPTGSSITKSMPDRSGSLNLNTELGDWAWEIQVTQLTETLSLDIDPEHFTCT